jgi:hypothetical protein
MLMGEGFEFEDDEFTIDRRHQKALNDLARRKITPYVLAYAQWCKNDIGSEEFFNRYDNLREIAGARDLDLGDELISLRPRFIPDELLQGAKHWLDQVEEYGPVNEFAVQRIASWCKLTLAKAPVVGVSYAYLAVRLLRSLPPEIMHDYPKKVMRALNFAVHHGHLEGFYTNPTKDGRGIQTRMFHPQRYDI